MPDIRLANPNDTDKIIGIFRASFPEELLRYTILACKGIDYYLRDTISFQNYGGSTLFIVYEDADAILGFAELRRDSDSLFLNHIYVHPLARGRKIGQKLLLQGISIARDFCQSTLHLDVFVDNYQAKVWYRSLGLSPLYEQMWLHVPLYPINRGESSWWLFSGLPQADRVHEVYGFSQFTLQTRLTTYIIGRLGGSLFRSTTVSILCDQDAMSALYQLDRGRAIICIGPAEPDAISMLHNAVHLARSERFAGCVDTVLGKLRRRAAIA